MPLFLVAFFAIYGGAHAYGLARARAALGLGRTASLVAVAVLAVLCAGPLIVHHLGTRDMGSAARAASWIAYTWMGLLFCFTWLHLALDGIRLAARAVSVAIGAGTWNAKFVSGRAVFLGCAAAAIVLGILATIEAGQIRVERVRLTTPKLPASTARIRVTQISDVHLGLMVRRRDAAAIADLVRDTTPDLLVSTGDLVDARPNHLDGLSELFRTIPAPYGKYAVIGNHEYYAGLGPALDFTRRAGFTVLRGQAIIVGDALRIVGVDDPAGDGLAPERSRSEAEVLGGDPSPLFTLLLKHRPVVTAEARSRVDLQLSGHTHRGQLFPFGFLVRLAYPLLDGLRPLDGGGALYVSRGTGTWGPRMRLWSPPEITVFDIERETGGRG